MLGFNVYDTFYHHSPDLEIYGWQQDGEDRGRAVVVAGVLNHPVYYRHGYFFEKWPGTLIKLPRPY